MKTIKGIACLSLSVMLAVPAFSQEKEEDRVKEAGGGREGDSRCSGQGNTEGPAR